MLALATSAILVTGFAARYLWISPRAPRASMPTSTAAVAKPNPTVRRQQKINRR